MIIDLDFDKHAYGAGESVSLAVSAMRAEGGAPAGAKISAVAVVDAKVVHESTFVADSEGKCTVGFVLPHVMSEGVEGNVTVTPVETMGKTIPLPGKCGCVLPVRWVV